MHSSQIAAQRRRANFFASSVLAPQEHDGSYQHLRAELGDENTNRLITNIGTLALSTGVEVSGVSLSDAVKRIIGSLTPAERKAMASGSATPPRVQALLENELKIAQQQQKQAQLAAAANSPEAGLDANRRGLIPGAFAAMDRDLRGRTTRSSEYSDLRTDSISSANYASSQFARTGLNYAVFSDLRSQGFDAPQIMAAVRETKSLGIDANRNAAPMARVQRDIPNAIPGLHQTGKNWRDVKELEEQQKRAQETGNAALAADLARRTEAARKAAEEHDASERARVLRDRPDRAQDHRQLQDATRKAALGLEASPTVRNDTRVSDAGRNVTPRQSRDAETAAARIQDSAPIAPRASVAHENDALLADAAPPTSTAPVKTTAAQTPAPKAQDQPTGTQVKTTDATPPTIRQQAPRIAPPTVRV